MGDEPKPQDVPDPLVWVPLPDDVVEKFDMVNDLNKLNITKCPDCSLYLLRLPTESGLPVSYCGICKKFFQPLRRCPVCNEQYSPGYRHCIKCAPKGKFECMKCGTIQVLPADYKRLGLPPWRCSNPKGCEGKLMRIPWDEGEEKGEHAPVS